jgi:hypothetical protein
MPKIRPYTITYKPEPIEHWIVKTPMGNIDVAIDPRQALVKATRMAAEEEPGTDSIAIKVAWLDCNKGFVPPRLSDIEEEELSGSEGIN